MPFYKESVHILGKYTGNPKIKWVVGYGDGRGEIEIPVSHNRDAYTKKELDRAKNSIIRLIQERL